MLFPYFAAMRPVGTFQNFIDPFAQKLLAVDAESLPMSAYNKRYLQHLLDNHLYYLEIYASVLTQLMQHSSKQAAGMQLADFGSGNGLLGMFAKFAGFKKVWLCDLDSDFMNASEILANELDIKLDGFVIGNVDALQFAVAHDHLDAVVGTDVIEHIYSLEEFMATIANMNPAMLTVFTTASNPDNFIKCRKLKKLQLQDELLGADPADSPLAGPEKTEPFLQLRKKIITEQFPQVSQTDLLSLSTATRGLIKADILTAVNAWSHNGEMPQPDTTSVNTCNPFNGSWTERILSISAYKKIYAQQGFSIEIYNGFYNQHNTGIKKYVNVLGNAMVKLTGKYAAPFIGIVGYKSQ